MTATSFELRYAQVARSLASHLSRYAREREPGEKHAVAVLQHELCQLWKEELLSQKEASNVRNT